MKKYNVKIEGVQSTIKPSNKATRTSNNKKDAIKTALSVARIIAKVDDISYYRVTSAGFVIKDGYVKYNRKRDKFSYIKIR